MVAVTGHTSCHGYELRNQLKPNIGGAYSPGGGDGGEWQVSVEDKAPYADSQTWQDSLLLKTYQLC